MRCKICNAIDAENFDERDSTYLCHPCHTEVRTIIFSYTEEDNGEVDHEVLEDD
jgi:hypothetical protein